MDLMSERQWKRWNAVGCVNAEKLTMKESAICRISLRQLRRIRKRVAEEGKAGLVHRSRGRRALNPDRCKAMRARGGGRRQRLAGRRIESCRFRVLACGFARQPR